MDRATRIGKYLARRALGAGSFATVWLADDELLDAQVAVKVLAENWAQHPDVRRRFIDEAKLLRRIDHERIVRVHDVDELPDGRPYFVMTWADRGTLHERLRDHAASGRPMEIEQAVRTAIEVCECLAVVHDFGAVHRDVKPSNVLFRSVRSHERAAAQRRGNELGDEQMVLGDFGLAKDLAAASGFTQAAGTPAYMAPEQARPTAIIDRRVDIYGAASVLYEMLTGRPALAATTLSEVRRDRDGSGIQPVRALRPDVPPVLAAAIGRGLAFDPDQRYASAPAFAEALAEGLEHLPRLAPAPTRPISLPPSPAGAAGRVHDLVALARRNGAADPSVIEAIEERLGGSLRVAEWTSGPSRLADLTLPRCQLTTTTDPDALVDTDVVVVVLADDVADADGRAALVGRLRERLSGLDGGPLAVVVVATDPTTVADESAVRSLTVDVVGNDDEGQRAVVELIDELSDRSSLVLGSAAIGKLRTALDASTTGSRQVHHDIADAIDALHLELPALHELAALRDDVRGRAGLPAPLRREMRRLFVWTAPSRRLGLDDATSDTMRAAVQTSIERWRTLTNTGRIPFSGRGAAELVERSLERLWIELEPDGS